MINSEIQQYKNTITYEYIHLDLRKKRCRYDVRSRYYMYIVNTYVLYINRRRQVQRMLVVVTYVFIVTKSANQCDH